MPDVEFLPPVKPRLFVCLPGPEFSFHWLAPFLELFNVLLHNFDMSWGFSQSCNIFDARNGLIPHMNKFKPDYVLWIDADNQVSVQGFRLLWEALQERKDISAIGAWYLINKPGCNALAAGWDGKIVSSTLNNFATKEPIEVEYIGFGFLLMRYAIIEKLSNARIDVFRPRLDEKRDKYHGDDVSFCRDARDLGFNFFLHPKVHSPHLKLLPIQLNNGRPAEETVAL